MRRWYVWLPVSGMLLAFILWRTRPWEASELWQRLDPLVLLIVAAFDIPIVALWALRTRILMARVGHPIPALALVPVVSFANTINNLTPASTGEVLRAVILRQRHQVPYKRSAAAILTERFWAIGIWAVTALTAAAPALFGISGPALVAAWLLTAVAIFLPSILYAIGLRPGRIMAAIAERRLRQGRIARVTGALAALDGTIADIVTDPRTALGFAVTTLGVAACSAMQLTLLLEALGTRISPLDAWGAYGLGIIAGALSGLPFGLGAADVVQTLVLSAAGVSAAAAAAAALLLRATLTLPLGLAGTASWLILAGGRPAAQIAAEGADGIAAEAAREAPETATGEAPATATGEVPATATGAAPVSEPADGARAPR